MAESVKVVTVREVHYGDRGGYEYEDAATFFIPMEVDLAPYWRQYQLNYAANKDYISFHEFLMAAGFQPIPHEHFDMEWRR